MVDSVKGFGEINEDTTAIFFVVNGLSNHF